MTTRPANHQVQDTDLGLKRSTPISDTTRKTHPKPSTTTTSTIYNLTNHFSKLKLNPNSKPTKTGNPLTKNNLTDTHLKFKSLSESVNLKSQSLKLGCDGHRACLGSQMDKSLVLVERKSDFEVTHLRNIGFDKSLNLESQTLKLGSEGKRACLGGDKEKFSVGVKKMESRNDFADTHLRNKGFNKSRARLGGEKEKSLVVDRGNDLIGTHLKVKGFSKSVNLESQTLKLGFKSEKDPQTLKLGLGGKNENGVKMVMGKRRSLCDVKMELVNFMITNSAKVVSTDMPPFMQIHAVGFARKTKDSLEKFTSKSLALSLKKEFDEAYGPAWHCIVGTSFGSFVTHSLGGFLYFALDQKWFILFFKTTVHKAG